MANTVLITGANGFVGSHIVDALLRRGDTVRAMVRPTSDLTWLKEKPVERVFGNLQDKDSLLSAVDGVDAVIHNAGVVSAPDKYLYYHHNTEGTGRLVEAVLEAAPKIKRFVYVSSQAAGGPTTGGKPRTEAEEAQPITDYGKSKLLAETLLRRYQDRLPITVIRPPSVYGPRDKAFFTLFQMIVKGWMPMLGRGRELSLVHVQDLARQVVLQMDHEKAIGEIFHAAPFEPTTFEDFGWTIARVLSATPRPVQVPDSLLRYGYPAIYPILQLLGVKPPFKADKLPDFLQPRWTINGEKAADLLGYEGKMPLLAGVGQTAEWYRWKKWLKTRRDRLKEKGNARTYLRHIDSTMHLYDESCDLCALAFDGEVKTKKHYEDDDFVIVDCLICRVPMAVLKEHRASFTDEEKERLVKIFHDLFGNTSIPDFEQRRIPEHAHVHYRRTRHAPPWVLRPEEAHSGE